MHHTLRLVTSSLVLALSFGCSTQPPPVAPAVSSTLETKGGAVAKPVAAFPVEKLRSGMPEAEVRNLAGAPDSIEKVAEDPLRARVFVYRRVVGSDIREVPSGTREVPVWAGPGQQESVKMVKEVILRKQLVTLVEVTRLLVYDDNYVEKTQKFEREEKFIE